MKTQTFILIMRNKDGAEVDFYRFSCKRLSTVLNNIATTIKKDPDFWYKTWWRESIENVYIHETDYNATPDNMVRSYSFTDFYNKAIAGTL